MSSHRKRSTLHRLSVVCPMNDNHEGPVPPGMGRECVDSTRHTTFLSMLAPNVRAMMRAIRGQPNRGLRDFHPASDSEYEHVQRVRHVLRRR